MPTIGGVSPKVYAPALAQIIAGIVIFLLTGDQSFLLITLSGIATGGIGWSVPHGPKLLDLRDEDTFAHAPPPEDDEHHPRRDRRKERTHAPARD